MQLRDPSVSAGGDLVEEGADLAGAAEVALALVQGESRPGIVEGAFDVAGEIAYVGPTAKDFRVDGEQLATARPLDRGIRQLEGTR